MLAYLNHSRWAITPVSRLRPYARNARTHSAKQIRAIATSIEKFGFTAPILIDPEGMILAGHARFEAVKLLGIRYVPTICLNLGPAQRRAYVIADNRLAEKAGWDFELLTSELAIVALEAEVELTGFSGDEIELLGEPAEVPQRPAPVIASPPLIAEPRPPTSRCGDVWRLGEHRLICGGADPACCDRLVHHFEKVAGAKACLAESGQNFDQVTAQRRSATKPKRNA